MNLTKAINQEIHLIDTDYFTLGEYIYMAMGLVKKHRVCIAVAYKIDYRIKKALQFPEVDHRKEDRREGKDCKSTYR